MTGILSARVARAVAVTLITLGASANQSIAVPPNHASPPTQPDVIELPAGLACAGFRLRVEIATNPNQVYTEFKDKNGNIVRSLTAGKGNTLTFTNLVTGEKLLVRSNGSVAHVALGADFETWTITGHNVLILFPTDVPAGPTTTLYVGRVVFTVDKATGVFTLESTSGHATDICASL
jgi:hypothetical protein